MPTQTFVTSVWPDHFHYATVDELPNSFGEGKLGTCTIRTVRGGFHTSDECLVWPIGPADTIAPNLQVLLANSQVLSGGDCLICTLNGQHYFWKLRSYMNSYTATGTIEQRGNLGCSQHGNHAVTVTHGKFRLNHIDFTPASRVSTRLRDNQTVLLLYPDEGDGIALLHDAFGTDTGGGCIFNGSCPVVCRVGNSAIKIDWKDVAQALSELKESDPLTGVQSGHSVLSNCCVTSVTQLRQGTQRPWVDVWVPGSTRTTLISDTL